jgi:hypothetical protein
VVIGLPYFARPVLHQLFLCQTAELLRATPAVVSILSLYMYYLTTLYLFFHTNSPAVLSIHSLFYLNILFFYSFILFKYYIYIYIYLYYYIYYLPRTIPV